MKASLVTTKIIFTREKTAMCTAGMQTVGKSTTMEIGTMWISPFNGIHPNNPQIELSSDVLRALQSIRISSRIDKATVAKDPRVPFQSSLTATTVPGNMGKTG